MTDILQWPVNPSRWLAEWRALGGDVVGDKVVNPPIWPGLELHPAKERRMSILSRQYNNPEGRQIIHSHIAGINSLTEEWSKP